MRVQGLEGQYETIGFRQERDGDGDDRKQRVLEEERKRERAQVTILTMSAATSEKINFSYYILLYLITSYSSYFGGKKGISGNKTSFFLLMQLYHTMIQLT